MRPPNPHTHDRLTTWPPSSVPLLSFAYNRRLENRSNRVCDDVLYQSSCQRKRTLQPPARSSRGPEARRRPSLRVTAWAGPQARHITLSYSLFAYRTSGRWVGPGVCEQIEPHEGPFTFRLAATELNYLFLSNQCFPSFLVYFRKFYSTQVTLSFPNPSPLPSINIATPMRHPDEPGDNDL